MNGKIKANGKLYDTIQAAIEEAAEGTEIFVPHGQYNEQVVINKNITLVGEQLSKFELGTPEFPLLYNSSEDATGQKFVLKITSPCTVKKFYIQGDNLLKNTLQPKNEKAIAAESALILIYEKAKMDFIVARNSDVYAIFSKDASPVISTIEITHTHGAVFTGSESKAYMEMFEIHHCPGFGVYVDNGASLLSEYGGIDSCTEGAIKISKGSKFELIAMGSFFRNGRQDESDPETQIVCSDDSKLILDKEDCTFEEYGNTICHQFTIDNNEGLK